ncbi:hypothetical protein M8009_12960 [Halomonas sp. ATCH28]|uniref:Replication protein n=1 Tax=Halomonas gemina TaxID=2945105 RepID=A0ABT0T3W6_9GAMM|nr:hypothetical protein [Halomonas gemina]MCL7941196.1 hypothetical protein [Halomonas gemina]
MSDTAEIFQFPTQERRPRVNSWRWNELEDEALEALPPEIERLYLRGIRKHMDYATGITGRKRRVSMDMFAEIVEYHPPAGSREKARLYSRQQITRMLDKLEDAGLIVRLHRGKGVKATMEFSLPLACCDAEQHRANSEPRGASQEKPHSRASGEGNSEQGASREERATSGSPVTPNPLTSFGGGASDELELQQPPAEPKPKPAAKQASYPDAFEAAWSAYPKRAGANPKRGAFKAWNARIAEGVPAETLQAGVERYAAFIRAKGDERSEFVMQGQRFFGPNGEYENEWAAPSARQAARPDGRKGFAQPQPQGSYTPTDMDNLPAWMRD